MRTHILAACLALATITAAAQAAGPNCETLVSHRDGLSNDEITVIEQTQARAKGMDPYAWDTFKLTSKMAHPAGAPVCVPH
jgi:hypothetical protein